MLFVGSPSSPKQWVRTSTLNLVFYGLLLCALGAFGQAQGGTTAPPALHPEEASTSAGAISSPAGTAIENGSTSAPVRQDLKREPPAIKTEGKYDVSKIGNRKIGKGLNLYSLERERAMGKDMADQIEQQTRLVSDPVITEYVNRIGQTLVRHSDAKVPFIIKVIDDDEINAFALPGGYFYVNTGLILAAENEAELAGVMAHEIAHVAARHATKTQSRVQIMNLLSIPLIFAGGPAGFAVRQVMGVAVPLGFLKFTRDEEREADLLGLEYQYASGYDPAEFVHFFETLKSREKEQKHGAKAFIAKAFTTHPMTNDRISRAQREIETMLPPKDQYIVDTSEFDEVKARLAGIVNGNRLEVPDPERPTLRRRSANTRVDDPQLQKTDRASNEDEDRPTLKRKP